MNLGPHILINLKRLGSLITFSAYKPLWDDFNYSIVTRMSGKSIALLNIGPAGAKIGTAVVNDGKLVLHSAEFSKTTALTQDLISTLKSKTDCNCILVSISGPQTVVAFLPSFSAATYEDYNKVLSDAPARIISGIYEKTDTYHMIPNLTGQGGIAIGYPTEEIEKVYKALVKADFKVLRMQHGTYNLLRIMLSLPEMANLETTVIRIPVVIDQAFAATTNIFGTWGPSSLCFGRTIFTPAGKEEDPFEQRERISTFFREMADATRSHLSRGMDFPVEFCLLGSDSRPQELVQTILTEDKIARVKILKPAAPFDVPNLDFYALIQN